MTTEEETRSYVEVMLDAVTESIVHPLNAEEMRAVAEAAKAAALDRLAGVAERALDLVLTILEDELTEAKERRAKLRRAPTMREPL